MDLMEVSGVVEAGVDGAAARAASGGGPGGGADGGVRGGWWRCCCVLPHSSLFAVQFLFYLLFFVLGFDGW